MKHKSISSWSEFNEFGINLLTGEACAFGQRILCDLNEDGVNWINRFFSTNIDSGNNWNSMVGEKPSVASIMLTKATLNEIAVFILFCEGYSLVAKSQGVVVGFDNESWERHKHFYEDAKSIQIIRNIKNHDSNVSKGDRNIHQFTGRTE